MTFSNWDEIYPSKYLKADDLYGQSRTMTIRGVDTEEFNDRGSVVIKPVLSFLETTKQLSLNKTNKNVLVSAFGKDPQACLGKKVVLFPSTTLFNGRSTPCIRLSMPEGKGEPEKVKTAIPGSDSDLGTGDIPW
jgi:hypothetical protein